MSLANKNSARVMAGIPALNNTFYRRLRFSVMDPAALIEFPTPNGAWRSIFILRDIEMQRARKNARVDQVHCPADFTPDGGLSGDRETATAQSVAECLRREGVSHVTADRTLPLIYAHAIQQVGIAVECDPEWGILARRCKDAEEIEQLREAQRVTESAVEMACRMIAGATADQNGNLILDGQSLTSERVRAAIDIWFLERDYQNPTSIIACGPQGADCHDLGSGQLRTEQPVIVDIFPRNRKTLYNGDCTRTVVHGRVPDEVARMHAAVTVAKQAGIAACRPGITGEGVHAATSAAIISQGYAMGLPADDATDDYCAMTHGTGHGVGLDVHEPPLLDRGGPELLVGDVLTVEPGLYCRAIGGVRLEDMVVVTDEGCENLNHLSETLSWD